MVTVARAMIGTTTSQGFGQSLGADAGIISTTALIFEATIKLLGVNKHGNNALITPRASNSFSRMA